VSNEEMGHGLQQWQWGMGSVGSAEEEEKR